MESLRIGLPLVDGSYLPLDYSTCKEAIHELVSDDFGPPPRSLNIEARTRDGKTVRIVIPYEDADSAVAYIDHD